MSIPKESSALVLPTTASLAARLSSILVAGEGHAGFSSIVSRVGNPYASSLPCEIVTCRLEDGGELRVLCKYGVRFEHSSRGHRGGVEYEATVYRNILRLSGVTTPRFYGTFVHSDGGHECLVVEYIDGACRLSESLDETAMGRTASWLGRFHAEGEARARRLADEGFKVYDEEYYEAWADHTLRLVRRLGLDYPWLTSLREAFSEAVQLLLSSGPTAVHGELYPHNVLVTADAVYPVDWETAAIAVGEIDVAALLEGWGEKPAAEFALEYGRARWATVPPPDNVRTLDAARLYWLFRWLGDRPGWTRQRRAAMRFRELQRVGVRMGLI
jgi:hypothetical protein